MIINVRKKSRRLETISERNILVFPDRKEIVEEIDINSPLNTGYCLQGVKLKWE